MGGGREPRCLISGAGGKVSLIRDPFDPLDHRPTHVGLIISLAIGLAIRLTHTPQLSDTPEVISPCLGYPLHANS